MSSSQVRGEQPAFAEYRLDTSEESEEDESQEVEEDGEDQENQEIDDEQENDSHDSDDVQIWHRSQQDNFTNVPDRSSSHMLAILHPSYASSEEEHWNEAIPRQQLRRSPSSEIMHLIFDPILEDLHRRIRSIDPDHQERRAASPVPDDPVDAIVEQLVLSNSFWDSAPAQGSLQRRSQRRRRDGETHAAFQARRAEQRRTRPWLVEGQFVTPGQAAMLLQDMRARHANLRRRGLVPTWVGDWIVPYRAWLYRLARAAGRVSAEDEISDED